MTPEAEADPVPDSVDEFDWIARCLAPLAAGAPEGLGLADDAALIEGRPGQSLVISKDAMVEGVHFLPDDPPELVARKLLRVNLSDLAAKGAQPYGYFLAAAWPKARGWAQRQAFAAGLAEDQAAFGLSLFGGDTVSTPGPLTLSLTILGWVRHGRMVRRAGARAGDVVLVSGTIGDGALGLEAARGGLAELDEAHRQALAGRYRLPQPRNAVAGLLQAHVRAAADISDGLIADAGHVAKASGVRLSLDLDRLPLSPAAAAWLARQPDATAARLHLATGGDDYELVCVLDPADMDGFRAQALGLGVAFTPIGHATRGEGVEVSAGQALVPVARTGYRHG